MLAFAVMLPFLLYAGSYLAMIKPGCFHGRPEQEDTRCYRFGQDYAETFYWPMELINRRVRPADYESW